MHGDVGIKGSPSCSKDPHKWTSASGASAERSIILEQQYSIEKDGWEAKNRSDRVFHYNLITGCCISLSPCTSSLEYQSCTYAMHGSVPLTKISATSGLSALDSLEDANPCIHQVGF